MGGALTLLVLTLTLPFLRILLNFAILPLWEYGMLAVTGLVIILIAELAKPRYKHSGK